MNMPQAINDWAVVVLHVMLVTNLALTGALHGRVTSLMKEIAFIKGKLSVERKPQ